MNITCQNSPNNHKCNCIFILPFSLTIDRSFCTLDFLEFALVWMSSHCSLTPFTFSRSVLKYLPLLFFTIPSILLNSSLTWVRSWWFELLKNEIFIFTFFNKPLERRPLFPNMLLYVFSFNQISSCEDDDGVSPDIGTQQLHILLQKPPIRVSKCRIGPNHDQNRVRSGWNQINPANQLQFGDVGIIARIEGFPPARSFNQTDSPAINEFLSLHMLFSFSFCSGFQYSVDHRGFPTVLPSNKNCSQFCDKTRRKWKG